MQPCSQFLHSCICEQFIYSHYRSYLKSYFPVLREITLGSTAGAERRTGNCRQASGWQQFPTLFSTPAVEPRVHKWINDQHTNFQLENYGLYMETIVNFLFGLRVNEIPNKTFLLDSHRPSICSAKFIIPFRNTCLVIRSKVSLIIVCGKFVILITQCACSILVKCPFRKIKRVEILPCIV